MFYRKSIFDEILREFEGMFEDKKTTFYRVGPNQVYFSYSSNDELSKLKSKLQEAVHNQEFETAVKLRDQIKSIEENGEKIQKLRLKLQESIDNEDFETSIELRDEIKKLQS